MIDSDENQWVTPSVAAKEMSKRAGYVILPADIRQLKRTGKITRVRKLTSQIALYNLQEIQTVRPPKKRKPVPYLEDTAPRIPAMKKGE